eukprot:1947270-Rhodomonas_salina.2
MPIPVTSKVPEVVLTWRVRSRCYQPVQKSVERSKSTELPTRPKVGPLSSSRATEIKCHKLRSCCTLIEASRGLGGRSNDEPPTVRLRGKDGKAEVGKPKEEKKKVTGTKKQIEQQQEDEELMKLFSMDAEGGIINLSCARRMRTSDVGLLRPGGRNLNLKSVMGTMPDFEKSPSRETRAGGGRRGRLGSVFSPL